MCESLDRVIQDGKLKRSEGERLRGRLQFAGGQLFGRTARNHLKLLSMHIQSGRLALSDETVFTLTRIRDQLSMDKPRKIVGSLSDHIHAYVDVSFDDTGYSGVGGVLFDSDGTVLDFFSQKIDQSLVDLIKAVDQETIIQELEMLSLAIAVTVWGPKWKGRRTVAFTDSEAVRGGFLKTWSNNRPCNTLLAEIFRVEEEFLCPIWLERVPSQSNPSDELSRSEVAARRGLQRARAENCGSTLPIPWGKSATTNVLRHVPNRKKKVQLTAEAV